jgi:hypothetical protein
MRDARGHEQLQLLLAALQYWSGSYAPSIAKFGGGGGVCGE